MKNKISIIFIFIMIVSFVGCYNNEGSDISMIVAPKNEKLDILGEWYCDKYEICDTNIANNESIYDILSKNIKIYSNRIQFGDKNYGRINYRLKLVKPDYKLSYEAQLKIEDIGINYENVKIYSITCDNNLLGEIIYESKEASYLYYQGILFYIKYVGEIKNNNSDIEYENNPIEEEVKVNSSQGLLLGLKTESSMDEYGNNSKEQYRTLWISTKSGKLSDITVRDNIILPRLNGIWELQSEVYKNNHKNIYYEYISMKILNGEVENQSSIANLEILSEGKQVKNKINYVGDDCIALEVETNEKFNQSPVYRVLPLDNLSSENSIAIGDLYNEETEKIFEKNYNNAYAKEDLDNKVKLSKNVNYSNFSLRRSNGHWVMEGRISPVLKGGRPVNFDLDIKPNKSLCNYDTLIIPWKILKAEVPLLEDAYTSPDGSIAILITNGELLVYKIESGKLSDEPSKRITLKENEKVIMAEWCENEYVSKWEQIFNKNSKKIG